MHPTMDIKDFIREVYNASSIMTRSCYLSARDEVRNTDAVQMCARHMITGSIQEKGKTNFLHSLNINCDCCENLSDFSFSVVRIVFESRKW